MLEWYQNDIKFPKRKKRERIKYRKEKEKRKSTTITVTHYYPPTPQNSPSNFLPCDLQMRCLVKSSSGPSPFLSLILISRFQLNPIKI